MTKLPPATRRNTAVPRDIACADIDIPPDAQRMRRAAVAAEADAGLADSIRHFGVLQPIIVRQHPQDLGRYILVKGARRLRAAIAAGLPTIPAELRADLTEAEAAAIEAAANMQRAALSPVDQWRAIVRLQDLGWNLDAAADALGIPRRQARRLDQLGKMHADMLALIERHGLPPDAQLAVIAAAAPDVQAAAIKKRVKGDAAPSWWDLAAALRQTRCPKAWAIFDTDAVPLTWHEDLFAEPGSPDAIYTTELTNFVAAQERALEAMAAASKGRIVVARSDYGRPKVPFEMQPNYGWKWGQPIPKGAKVFATISEQSGMVDAVCAAKPPKEGTADDDAADRGDDAETEGTGAPGGPDGPATPARRTGPPAGPPPRISRDGAKILQDIRAAALRAALLDRTPPDPVRALRLLLVGLGARNLYLEGSGGERGIWTDECAAAAMLAGDDGARLSAIAMQALALILKPDVQGPFLHDHSGPAADWIGHAIGADACLPRMDTEELLAEISDDALTDACHAAGVTPGKTPAATRKALAGRAGDAVLLPEARFRFAPIVIPLDERSLPHADQCGQAAGLAECQACDWQAKTPKGMPAPGCDRALWRDGLARLGLTEEDWQPGEKDTLILRLPPEPPAEDPATAIARQRAEDAAAFDQAEAAPAGPPPRNCGWDGSNACRHHGKPHCRGCDDRPQYEAFLLTPRGDLARLAWERSVPDAHPVMTSPCAWSGTSICREDGTTVCQDLCPRHAKYAAWLDTQAGRAARRAEDNRIARESLRAPRKKRTQPETTTP